MLILACTPALACTSALGHLLYAHAQRPADGLEHTVQQRGHRCPIVVAVVAIKSRKWLRSEHSTTRRRRRRTRASFMPVPVGRCVAKQRGDELTLARERLVHPRKHVIDVALGVVRVDLNRAGHAARPSARERRDEALEERVVARRRDLLAAVLEEHGALAQRSDRRLQRRADLRGVVVGNAAALALHPPARTLFCARVVACCSVLFRACALQGCLNAHMQVSMCGRDVRVFSDRNGNMR
eukprot:365206-Chlamydomonas_euryale.AAC.2